jgi:Ser/Thr protein kinase RdoA (MazF antagonist)
MGTVTAHRPPPGDVPAAVREAFNLTGGGTVIRPAGADSENFRMLTRHGNRVVVRWDAHPGRPLDAAADWCTHLTQHNLRVTRPHRTTTGSWVAEQAGDWTCWDEIVGDRVSCTVENAYDIGQLLATVHTHSTPLVTDHTPAPCLLNWVSSIDGDHRTTLARVENGPPAICHMDAHAGNTLRNSHGLWLIDWVDGGRSIPALDAAVAACYWGGEGGYTASDALLDGYASQAATATPDRALLRAACALLTARAAANNDRCLTGLLRYATELDDSSQHL